MKHPPGALNTIKSFTSLAIHHSVYEEERVEWGFFLVRIRWGEKIVIRIRITIKIRMKKRMVVRMWMMPGQHWAGGKLGKEQG